MYFVLTEVGHPSHSDWSEGTAADWIGVEIRAGIAGYVNVITTSIRLLNRRIEMIPSPQWRLLVQCL